jgi:cytochrome c biogenesis protein CcmG/thiol:disulfide interchange protein DsbE
VRRLALAALAAAAVASGCGDAAGGPVVVGRPAPAYEARTLDGAPASLAALRGRPVLLNVWATWCGPCEKEMPDLQRLHERAGPRGLVIVGVSIDQPSEAEAVRQFARERGVTFALWHDPDDRVSSTFRLMGVPTTFLVASDGTLLWRHTGPLKADDPKLAELIDQAVAAAAPAS